ncbi:MAG: PRC-barrel domain-containing protein [Methylacidiphilales bacterium]|nr:PRC-barrel domain-containing protein [Candidatus Methylacidiphilales bacterium]
MLQNIKELYGNKLVALDGEIGLVKDFYFNDKTWMIRYLVADTEPWLPERLVLLSPHAFGQWDEHEKSLRVKLSKKQIENSPPLESHIPVSRQYEIAYHRYYGWPSYWDASGLRAPAGYPEVPSPSKDDIEGHLPLYLRKDKHLRSTQAVTGYHIQTVDGAIGRVSGFLADDHSWAIRDLVVESGHWYRGKEILISPSKIERISYEESKVFVNLTVTDIQRTPENILARVGSQNHAMEIFRD